MPLLVKIVTNNNKITVNGFLRKKGYLARTSDGTSANIAASECQWYASRLQSKTQYNSVKKMGKKNRGKKEEGIRIKQ